jgi:Flp pilus assembly pilin Flp
MFSRTHQEERGQTLVEYALIIAVVSLGSLVALGFLSGTIQDLFSKTGNAINGVAVAAPSGGGSGNGSGTSGPAAPASPSITSGPAEGSSGNSAAFTNPSFSFTGDGTQTSFECSLDGGTFGTCTSPTSMGPGLGAGAHSFAVQATNGGGSSAPTTRSWTVTAAAAVPTPGSVSIDCPGSGQNCDEGEDATATTSGWNANGSAITGYYFEWYDRSDSSCASGGSWGSVEDRDPNSGSDLDTTQEYDLPGNFGDYTIRVVVHAVNGVGTSTAVAEACAVVDA